MSDSLPLNETEYIRTCARTDKINMFSELFFKGNYGIERETLRVDKYRKFVTTPHPFSHNNYITKDYCENQLEIITPVCKSIDELIKTLETLDSEVRTELNKNKESLWLYSNPPYFENENDIIISNFSGDLLEKRLRFENLEKKYGKRLFTLSGIHFNFSFDDTYLQTLCDKNDFEAFKYSFYLKLYKQLYIHSWLPLILTAASPVCNRSLYDDGERGFFRSEYASIRNSEKGFWNNNIPILKYDNRDSFIISLEKYVEENLFSVCELYLPIRLKPIGTNSLENYKKGISHIEFRMLDINPFEPLGIDKNDLEFIHLLIMYLSMQDDFELTEKLQREAILNHQRAALYDLTGVQINGVDILKKAEIIINNMQQVFADDNSAEYILKYEHHKLNDRLCTHFQDDFLKELYKEG